MIQYFFKPSHKEQQALLANRQTEGHKSKGIIQYLAR